MNNINQILEKHVEYFKTPIEVLKSESRKHSLVIERSLFAIYCRLLRYTFSEIGKKVGRDHSTIMNNVSTYYDLMENDIIYKVQYVEYMNFMNNDVIVVKQEDEKKTVLSVAYSENLKYFIQHLGNYKGMNINETLIEKIEKNLKPC